MSTIARIGLAMLFFGTAMHTWHDLDALLLAWGLMIFGSVFLVIGDHIEQWLSKLWPDIHW